MRAAGNKTKREKPRPRRKPKKHKAVDLEAACRTELAPVPAKAPLLSSKEIMVAAAPVGWLRLVVV